MTSSKHNSYVGIPATIGAIPEFALLCSIILVIVAIQILLIKLGFTSVSTDEYSRLLLAADWAATPRDYISSIWLPGHAYLLGLALKLHYDLLITPRIFGIATSIAVLLLLYLITRRFFDRWAALICVLLVGLNRTFLALSLTPMVEMTYWAFLLTFLYFYIVWLEDRHDSDLVKAAFGLSIAVSIRYDIWFTMTAFEVYLAFIWIRSFLENRSLKPAWLLSAILPAAPVLAWIFASYKRTGNPFHFASDDILIQFNAEGLIGPLSDLSPYFAYFELLLLNGGLAIVLAVSGIALARARLGLTLWIYLAMGLIPLFVLTALVVSKFISPPTLQVISLN